MRQTADRPRLNIRMLLKVLGWLLLIEGGFMLIPMCVGLGYGESDWTDYLAGALITLGAGMFMTRGIHARNTRMARREGFLLTACVWVVFSLFGLIPFMLSMPGVSFTDAFFEAMSGFTTTGASVLDDSITLSHSAHIWRAMMQWIGGMGIILFTLAVVPMLNSSGGIQMFNAEVTGITHDKVRPRISQTAKALWLLYMALTALCALLLWAGPMDLFESICHAIGTLSTGGYTTRDTGVNEFASVYVLAVITVFMLLGGTNFGLLIRALTRGPRQLLRNEIFRYYITVILVMLAVFMAAMWLGHIQGDWRTYTVYPLFQIVSVLTSTGYCIPGFADWGMLPLCLIFVMMFVGGCAGSTSGGAKIDRVVVLIKYCRNEINRCVRPNSVTAVRLEGRSMTHPIVTKVIAFLCLYMILVLVGTIFLSATGVDAGHAFFSSFSCISNAGVSAADAVYGNDYSTFPAVAKWTLSGLMLIGRLEIFTILILVSSAFWKK